MFSIFLSKTNTSTNQNTDSPSDGFRTVFVFEIKISDDNNNPPLKHTLSVLSSSLLPGGNTRDFIIIISNFLKETPSAYVSSLYYYYYGKTIVSHWKAFGIKKIIEKSLLPIVTTKRCSFTDRHRQFSFTIKQDASYPLVYQFANFDSRIFSNTHTITHTPTLYNAFAVHLPSSLTKLLLFLSTESTHFVVLSLLSNNFDCPPSYTSIGLLITVTDHSRRLNLSQMI